MDHRIKNMARMGYLAKGAVYALTGLLAIGAAFGLSHRSEGKRGILKFMQEQPFGNLILGFMGLGLLCYAFWRIFQSIRDPEDIGSDVQAMGKRLGFLISGLVYLGLGVYSIYQVLKPTATSSSTRHSMIPIEYLNYIFYAVAIGLAIKAIFQLVKVYNGKFIRKLYLGSISNVNARKSVKLMGYVGMTSRAVVAGIVSYFFFRAADTANTDEIKGTADAFSFLRQNSEGPWLIGLVALGLMSYGAYMLTMAKYRRFAE